MILQISDREAIDFIRSMRKSDGGRAALALIGRMAGAKDVAYVPGRSPEEVAYVCGKQQLYRDIEELSSENPDWDEIDKKEREQRKKQEDYNGRL